MLRVLGIAYLAFFTSAMAIETAVRDTWSGIGVAFNSNGVFSGGRCGETPYFEGATLEFPLGSTVQHTTGLSLWLGAEIQVDGQWIPRVSTASDLWSNPSTNELHPNYQNFVGIRETSRFDTSYDLPFCTVTPETEYYSRADHEFFVSLADTLTDPLFVNNDPVDGAHVPLGLQIDLTTYSFLSFCRQVTWVRLNVTNIGPHSLRNLWCGLAGFASVYTFDSTNVLGAVGYDHDGEYAYVHAQTGRANESADGPVIAPGAIGIVPLYDDRAQSVSFNWWTPYVYPIDYGPAWESYANRDSLGLGWTFQNGAPDRDVRRYQLMSNREIDFDMIRFSDTEWIASHTPPQQRWAQNGPDNEAFRDMLETPFPFLLSSGPHGVQHGEAVALNQGESVDIWFAVIGGAGFNDNSRPHPAEYPNPDLYDFTDLRERAWLAKQSPCFTWLDTPVPREALTPGEFALSEAFPNPFNGETRMTFLLPRGTEFELGVFDLLGRQVEMLSNGTANGEETIAVWRPSEVGSGVYFIRLQASGHAALSRKVLLLK